MTLYVQPISLHLWIVPVQTRPLKFHIWICQAQCTQEKLHIQQKPILDNYINALQKIGSSSQGFKWGTYQQAASNSYSPFRNRRLLCPSLQLLEFILRTSTENKNCSLTLRELLKPFCRQCLGNKKLIAYFRKHL